jgi:hypothetical protein
MSQSTIRDDAGAVVFTIDTSGDGRVVTVSNKHGRPMLVLDGDAGTPTVPSSINLEAAVGTSDIASGSGGTFTWTTLP